jgi:hypothetical protein
VAGVALVGDAQARLDGQQRSYQAYSDARGAETERTAGWVALGAGAGLLLAGVIRYAVAGHRAAAEARVGAGVGARPQVSVRVAWP